MQNVAGTLLPFAAPLMIEHLGVAWTSTILGCIALILIPVPFLFVKYGAQLNNSRDIMQSERT
jgi:MFS transporter, DHA1 family, multidrug resistance protein